MLLRCLSSATLELQFTYVTMWKLNTFLGLNFVSLHICYLNLYLFILTNVCWEICLIYWSKLSAPLPNTFQNTHVSSIVLPNIINETTGNASITQTTAPSLWVYRAVRICFRGNVFCWARCSLIQWIRSVHFNRVCIGAAYGNVGEPYYDFSFADGIRNGTGPFQLSTAYASVWHVRSDLPMQKANLPFFFFLHPIFAGGKFHFVDFSTWKTRDELFLPFPIRGQENCILLVWDVGCKLNIVTFMRSFLKICRK
jgi:hypothetical protein